MKILIVGILSLMIAGDFGPAVADTFPSRPITMIVPLAAGGSTDTVGRIVAEGMRPSLGQPIVVENTAGAGGTVGLSRLVRANPDGYTLMIGQWGTNVATGAVYDLPFDLMTDLEPVGLISTQPFMLVGRKDLPANNLQELMAWAKERGDKVSVGTAGLGAAGHIAGVLFQNLLNTRFQFIPYRSAGQSIQGLVAGQLDLNFDTPATSKSLVSEGLVKAYAVTAATRSPAVPEVPTVDEAGLAGFHFGFWHGLWVPKGTPEEVVKRLNAALQDSLNAPVVRKRLADSGQEIFPAGQITPAALRSFQKAEIVKWWPIIKEAGIRAQ